LDRRDRRRQFGLTQKDRKMVVLLMFLQEVHAIGLAAAHGLYITDGFYWDENDPARTWSRRFFGRMNKMPSKSPGEHLCGGDELSQSAGRREAG
jgi:Periplasmic binding protein